MFFHIKTVCKEKKLIKHFLLFFTKSKYPPVFLKYLPKNEKRKFITILKSPHVNKTAQEQFEYRLYSSYFLVRSHKPSTFFSVFKKVKNFSFSGINFKVEGLLEKNKTPKHALRVLSPDNIILKSVTDFSLNEKQLKKVQYKKNYDFDFFFYQKYIQLYDLCGETYLKKGFFNSYTASLAQLDRATAF